MKRLLSFALLFSFIVPWNASAAQTTQPNERAELVSKLREIAKNQVAAIEALKSEKVADEIMENIGSCIIHVWCNSTITLYGNPQWQQNREYDRLDALFADFEKKGKFRVLNDDIRQKLHLEKLLCKIPEHCTSVAAFYLPMTDQIFIDTSLPEAEQRIAIVHEMRHAYQYTYRFPVDLAELSQDVRQGRLKAEDLPNYLDFYYEAQANWKAFRAIHEDYWVPYFSDFSSNPNQKGPGFFKNLGGHFRVNSYLPSMERSSILSMEKFEFSTKEKAWEGLPALVLPEIVCVDGIPHNDGDDNFDLAFHARYCKAIEKYYFGTLPFLFQKNRHDLEILNDLHDNYSRKLGGNDRVGPNRDNIRMVMSHYNEKCVRFIEKIRNSETAPMVNWLSFSQRELGVCSVYSSTLTEDDSNQFIRYLLKSYDPDSPFEIVMPGGEGSHPELKVYPSMKIMPQLKVTPEVLDH